MKSTDTQAARGGVSRRTFIRLGSAVVGAGALALALPGCGASTQGAAQGGDKKVVKVVTNNATRPYCYVGDDDAVVGYDVDALKLVEEKLGGAWEFSFDAMQFTSMIGSLQSGACDLVSCALSRTEERLEKFLVPDEPYGLAPMVLAHRKDDNIETLADMAGRTLRCNSTLAEYQAVVKYNREHATDEQIVINDTDPVVSDADLFRAVANGQADGVLIFKDGFGAANAAAGTDLAATQPVLVNALYFLLRKDEPELAEAISGALAEAKKDGSLGEVAKRWLGEDVFAEYDFPAGADIVVDGGEVVYSVTSDGVYVPGSASAEADASASRDGETRGQASSRADSPASSRADAASSSRD